MSAATSDRSLNPTAVPSPAETQKWRNILFEAAQWGNGEPLRHLFAILLATVGKNSSDQPDWKKLWEEFRQDICADLRTYVSQRDNTASQRDSTDCSSWPPNEESVHAHGLYLLDLLLGEHNMRLWEIPGMPRIEKPDSDSVPLQLHADPSTEQAWSQGMIVGLNAGQRSVFEAVTKSALGSGDGSAGSGPSNSGDTTDASSSHNNKIFFVDGPAGTGKTHLYNCITAHMKSNDRIVISVASTPTAATLLRGGRYAKDTFRIGQNPDKTGWVCKLETKGHYATVLGKASVLIWDEIGSEHRDNIYAVDQYLRKLRESEEAFGGMTVLFGGDFRQIPPFIRHGKQEDIVSASIRQSDLWSKLSRFSLTENLRLSKATGAQRQYGEWLLAVAHGHETWSPDAQASSSEPPKRPARSHYEWLLEWKMLTVNSNTLLDRVYGDMRSAMSSGHLASYFGERTVLARSNDCVGVLNREMVHRFRKAAGRDSSNSACRDWKWEGTSDAKDMKRLVESTNDADILDRDNHSGVPLRDVECMVGFPVMLLRDLCPAGGLFNGTRMIITRVSKSNQLLQVRIIGEHQWKDKDSGTPRTAFIPCVPCRYDPQDAKPEFEPFIRLQFPIRLAFAMTIMSAQGQSFSEDVGVDLSEPLRDTHHGQFYVAMSRARDPSKVHICLPTLNVVFQGLLDNKKRMNMDVVEDWLMYHC